MMSAMEHTEEGYRLPLAVAAAAVALLFLPVVLGGESFFGRDVTPYFYPMKEYLSGAVASGRIPLWNALVAGGEPFFASLQPGVLYPGSLVLHVLPFPQAVDWLIVVHYLFAAAGWILLLRHESRTAEAAAFGALAFVLGGFFVSLGNFVNNLQTTSWAPWLFLAWSLFLRDGTAGRLVAFSAACVAAFLGGEPQLLGLVLAVVLARGLLGPGAVEVPRAKQLGAFAGAGVLALLVAGVQLVPFLEFIGESVRTMPLELSYSASRSQEPLGLLHLLLPPALAAGEYGFTIRHLLAADLPWLLSLYPGVVVAGFAGLGLAGVRRRERTFWLLLALGGLLLALGSHTPVYRLAFAILEPLRAFRYPEKFALLLAVGLPFLAAAGLDRWRAQPDGQGQRRLTVVFAALAVLYGLLAVLLLGFPDLPAALCGAGADRPLLCDDPATAARLYAGIAARLAALLAAAVGTLVLVRRGTLRGSLAAWVVVGLAVLDLVAAHRPVNPSVESDVYTTRPWAAESLAPVFDRRSEYRFRGTPVRAAMGEAVRVRGAAELSNLYLDTQAMGPNTASLFDFPQQDGLQGVELRSVAMTHDAAIHGWAGDPVRFLQRMNVRYYADATSGADSMRGLVEVARHPELPIRLFEVPEPLPRAFVATGWETAGGPGRALQRALQAGLPPRTVVLEEAGPETVSASYGEAPGRIVAATWRPERVRLVVRSAAPGLLVLLDRWYPGWEVTVNGRRALLRRANGVFRAVEVPAGQADVEFRFRPRSLRIGAGLTALGLLVSAGLLWRGGRRIGGGG